MTEAEVSDGVHSALAAPSTWEEPPASLERDVVDAIRAAAIEDRPAAALRQSRPSLLVPSVAAVVVLVLGAIALLAWPSDGDGAGSQAFALAGTRRAPDASALVTVEETDAGAKILFDAEHLAPAPPDTYYEGWVDGLDGERVSIGTFHLHAGDRPIALWAGVDLAEYPILTVTLEPEDGDARSSDAVVLRGSIPE